MKTKSKSALRPADRWAKLKAELLAEIEMIDALTPWKETEPEWWMEMMAVQRAATQNE